MFLTANCSWIWWQFQAAGAGLGQNIGKIGPFTGCGAVHVPYSTNRLNKSSVPLITSINNSINIPKKKNMAKMLMNVLIFPSFIHGQKNSNGIQRHVSSFSLLRIKNFIDQVFNYLNSDYYSRAKKNYKMIFKHT